MLPVCSANGNVSIRDDVSGNLKFDGVLVPDPCELDPQSAEIALDFGTVIDTYLYLHTRTLPQPVTLRLRECNLALGNQVEVTFRGTESTALPGCLAVGGPAAGGIAIGMEMQDGTPLPLNKTMPAFTLSSGTNELRFNSYVIAEPAAQASHTLRRGAFVAMVTFELNYP